MSTSSTPTAATPTAATPPGASSDWRQPPIAVVGMAVLLPGAPDLDTYWRNLLAGTDAITEVPPNRWDPALYDPRGATGRPSADRIYCRRGGFVDEFAHADPLRFGIPPHEVESIEPDQLIALRVAAAAIDDAGGIERLGDLRRTGVVLGRGGYLSPGFVRLNHRVRTARHLVDTVSALLPDLDSDDLERIRAAFLEPLGPEAPESAMGIVPNLAASRIANRLNLGGPAFTVDAACASSLVAVDSAVSALASGRCDTMLAGGVHHCHDITLWSVFTQLRALSRTQRSQPFDRNADGLLIGEGTGMVVLRRLADARRDGDRIYAVIRGTGVSSDGRGGGLVSPDPAGQAAAIERAWDAAGLDPRAADAVGLIEAHGTGTPTGDEAELATLAQVFGGPGDGDPDETRLAALGSVKAMIGHTMAAAGIAGLVKAVLALHHRVLLPAVNCAEPHPALTTTRFRLLPAPVPWESAGVRRAGVNAFGFGGTNAHVVLEESPAAAPPAPDPAADTSPRARERASLLSAVAEPEVVLRLAAATPDELAVMVEVEDETLRRDAVGTPAFTGVGARLGLVNPTPRRLAAARHAVGGMRLGTWQAWRGRSEVWASAEPLAGGPGAGRTAFVFPGLEPEFSPQIHDVADRFGFSLPPDLSAAALGTHGTSVLLVSRVLDRVLRRMRIEPDALAGHSIGEWSAMFAAGMFDESEADASVFAADPYDGDVPQVDYASLACSSDDARKFIADLPDVVLSHDNAPLSTVVCGPPAAIERLADRLRRKNVVVQIMPFRSGFHTPMLLPYLPALRARTDRLRIRQAARVELWSATTGAPYPADLAAVRELFIRHLVEPVLFRQTIEAMYATGVRVFIQVGPGRLGGLIDGVLEDRPHLTIPANSAHRDGIGQLRRVAVALWVEHGNPDFAVLDGPAIASGPGGRTALVRLALGAEVAAVDPTRLPRVGPPTAGPGQPATAMAGHPLAAWADRDPMARQILDLITDTADTAAALLAHTHTHTTEPVPVPVPAPEVGRGAGPASSTGVLREEPSGQGWTSTLRVSVAAMPYLLDHSMTPQPPSWPDLEDSRPVVAATTIVRLMADYAAQASGRIPVGVYDVRFDSWLRAEPPVDVAVSVRPEASDRFRVTFAGYASGLVRVADAYSDVRPPRWPVDHDTEQAPTITGRDLYRTRMMFHGPAFQAVTTFLGYGPSHVRAVLRGTGTPGALLDAAGQLLGYWIRMREKDRFVMFPVRFGAIEFHGPEPARGTPVTCHVWVREINGSQVDAHMQLVDGNQVWAVVHGWVDRRFDLPAELDEAFRWPELHPLSQQAPDGSVVATERWADLAVREMVLSRYIGAAERPEYDLTPPRQRREWLLRRIAVKDAVRGELWKAGRREVFPVQIRVTDRVEPPDRDAAAVTVAGVHGYPLPPFAVSVTSTPDAARAIAQPATAEEERHNETHAMSTRTEA
ncbi:beta-ketoacyl synthase [Frankia sp. CcI49]|uniref:type I polyketide synthase n=1 Tax=Frankia sp. CcI49 TaxID=1745382 RepID=UPI00097626A4|nr:type I polyketide synthase [Frankia sp. CcI49]ONH60032.1 beta-ketoacyl synthase [Frankia sp. CcI49]